MTTEVVSGHGSPSKPEEQRQMHNRHLPMPSVESADSRKAHRRGWEETPTLPLNWDKPTWPLLSSPEP